VEALGERGRVASVQGPEGVLLQAIEGAGSRDTHSYALDFAPMRTYETFRLERTQEFQELVAIHAGTLQYP
jgi:hypothetical protein